MSILREADELSLATTKDFYSNGLDSSDLKCMYLADELTRVIK